MPVTKQGTTLYILETKCVRELDVCKYIRIDNYISCTRLDNLFPKKVV